MSVENETYTSLLKEQQMMHIQFYFIMINIYNEQNSAWSEFDYSLKSLKL